MSEPENPDDALNQWQENLGNLAGAAALLFGMYSACVAQGFTPEQAMQLVVTLFTEQLRSASKNAE